MNEIIAKDTSGALQKIYTPPAGEIMLFAGDAVPDGWLPCNGALVNRSAYPELFAAIGTIYGTGDGSTTFALPDTADRFPRFAGTLDVGLTQEAGLPDITGLLSMHGGDGSSFFHTHTGAFLSSSETTDGSYRTLADLNQHWGVLSLKTINFSAANSSAIYGNSNSVQPPAVAFKACIKY